MSARTLYVTSDGLLQPLGHSQVVRVIEKLAKCGHPYDVLSLERPDDLARGDAVAKVQSQLSSAGISWSAHAYDVRGGGKAAFHNIATLSRLVVSACRGSRYSLVHARSYHGGLAAQAAFRLTRTPYIFDARAYWIDERYEEGRWFTHPVALSAARAAEHRLFSDAAAVVCLTEIQADDIRLGRFGDNGGRPVVAIPTCADFGDFTLERRKSLPGRVAPDVWKRVRGKKVLGFVGSINKSYRMEESARVAVRAAELDPSLHVLALSGQRAGYEALFASAGLSPDRYTIARADHDAMPDWVALLTWGILLLEASPAKRGSMPTKLAEFFASGVRALHYGGNAEIASWVRRAASGYVMTSLDARALDAAAQFIATSTVDADALAKARAIAEPHFGLSQGVARYAQLLHSLFSNLKK